MSKISVVIPTFNESRTGIFSDVLAPYQSFPNIQLIIADGGSSDSTLEIAIRAKAEIVHTGAKSRAERINQGIAHANGEIVILNHPRSILDVEGIQYILDNASTITWGGFTHRFDRSHPFLKFTSWYSNQVRCKLRGIIYLDHCKFARKEIIQQACPLPKVDIFEDSILSIRLKKISGPPKLVPFKSTTSSVRFIQNGMFKQGIMNQLLKVGFILGTDHKKMNMVYEKKISLNTDYEK